MFNLLYTITLAIILNGHNSAFGGVTSSRNTIPSTNDDFNIDDFDYQGDPIKFSCITTHSYASKDSNLFILFLFF